MNTFTLFIATVVCGAGLAASAFAERLPVDKTRFVCATYHLTTSYVLIEKEGEYELQVLHHNGIEFMPIHEGIVTFSDLAVLNDQMKLISPMGDRYVVRFQKDQCENKNDQWVCYSPNPTTLGRLAVKNVWFKVSPRKVVTNLGSFDSYYVRFAIGLDSLNVNLPMEYDTTECSFR